MDKETLTTYFEARLDDYLSFLEGMVAINSFTQNGDGVNHLGEKTGERFKTLGFRQDRVPSDTPGFGNHFVWTRMGTGECTVALVSHLDLCPPDSCHRFESHPSKRSDKP